MGICSQVTILKYDGNYLGVILTENSVGHIILLTPYPEPFIVPLFKYITIKSPLQPSLMKRSRFHHAE